MKITKVGMILALAVLCFCISACSKKDKNLSAEGLAMSNPSKIKDLFSMIMMGGGKKGPQDVAGPLKEDEVRDLLKNYFEALRWQENMAASVFISERFFSPRYGTKKGYVKYLKTSAENSRILKLDPKIESINLFEDRALAVVNLDGIYVYLKSGLINEFKDSKLFIWIEREVMAPKIVEISPERDLPLSSISGEIYTDYWLFYKFALPPEYMLIKNESVDGTQNLQLVNKTKPVEIHVNVIFSDEEIKSSENLVQKDLDYLQKLTGFKLIKRSKIKFKNYDASETQFTFLDRGTIANQQRTYFWRQPLMYVVSVFGEEGEIFKKGMADYAKLLNSFSYIDAPADFKKSLFAEERISGPKYINNFYKYTIDAPADWKIGASKSDTIQFKPLELSQDAVAYIKTSKISNQKTLTQMVERNNNLAKFAFKYFKVIESQEESLGGLTGEIVKSKFKRRLLAKSRYKEAFFFNQKGILYEFALISTGWDENKRDSEFKKFVETINLF
jgi:hypothetical protein